MASKSVVDAVLALLEANPIAINGQNVSLIAINDNPSPPADGSAFLTLQFPTSSEKLVGMAAAGNRMFREEGTLRLVLAIPRGQGLDPGLAAMDQLRSLVRLLDNGGVRFLVPSPPISNDSSAGASYYVLSSSTPYQLDFIA